MAGSKSLAEAIKKVKTLSASKTDAGTLAREILPLLNQVSVEMAGKKIIRPSRRGTGKIAYLVEITQQGDVLTEERLSGKSKAFRCPQAIYQAVADVLSKADRPLLLDEIVAAVEVRLGDRPADFQIRLPLRLWLHVDPVLVCRNRARYRADQREQFFAKTQELWRLLR